MINHAAKTIPAETVQAIENFIRTGGVVHRIEPKSTKESDRWVLRLRMLHGSKGHTYVR